MLVPDDEIARRRKELVLPELQSQTPWQEIYRNHVGQLSTGAVLENAVKYKRIAEAFGVPRDNH